MAIFVRVVFEGRVENEHKFENIIFRVPGKNQYQDELKNAKEKTEVQPSNGLL